MLRLLIWYQVERQIQERAGIPIGKPYNNTFLFGYLSQILQHATEIVGSDNKCFVQLEQLLDSGEANIDFPAGLPGTLELAGLAKRDGGFLHFASPIIATFAKLHYDNRRMGDLYAQHNMWEQAFARYRKDLQRNAVRPWGTDDRVDVQYTLRSLSAEMHRLVAEDVGDLTSRAGQQAYQGGLARIRQLFVQGCRNVLGFSHVMFWHYDGRWTLEAEGEHVIAGTLIGEIERALPQHPLKATCKYCLLPLSGEWKYCAMLAILPGMRSDHCLAVLIGDLDNQMPISRERRNLLTEIFAHFCGAYIHAIGVQGIAVRLNVRERHLDIMKAIFAALGTHINDVSGALEMAGNGLCELGYKRVMFSLVDPECKLIKGVLGVGELGQEIA